MEKRLPRVFIPFILVLSLITCLSKKEDPTPLQLPAITQTGATTFGCMINGVLMVSVDKCRGGCPPNPRYDPSIGLAIIADMDSVEHVSMAKIRMQFDYINKEGKYSFDTMVNAIGSANIRCGLSARKYFGEVFTLRTLDTGTFYRGQIHISKWVKGQSGFVAGTFWFDLYNPARYRDTVRVQDGRFDIPFN